MSTDFPDPTNHPASTNSGDDNAAELQKRLVEFAKSPLVLAGGALFAGLLLTRLVGADTLRALAGNWLGGQDSGPAPLPPPPPPPPPPPASPIQNTAGPALSQAAEIAKKLLADFLAKKQ